MDESTSHTPLSGNPSQVILDHNSRVHQQVKKFLADDAFTFQFDRLSIDTMIADLDPTLWSAICSLTTSVSEHRHTLKMSDSTTHAQHVKKVRRFYCLCTLMSCTDDCCYLPLHNLITDVVDSLGGSTQLLKILNRLGVYSSSDSLARYTGWQNEKWRNQSRNVLEIPSLSFQQITLIFCIPIPKCSMVTSPAAGMAQPFSLVPPWSLIPLWLLSFMNL